MSNFKVKVVEANRESLVDRIHPEAGFIHVMYLKEDFHYSYKGGFRMIHRTIKAGWYADCGELMEGPFGTKQEAVDAGVASAKSWSDYCEKEWSEMSRIAALEEAFWG